MSNKNFRKTIIFGILIVFVLIVLFPIFWMISTSLKTRPETFNTPPNWIPNKITFKAYIEMWTMKNFSKYFINTLIVSISATILSLFLSIPASYGFARFKFKGSRTLISMILLTQMLPLVILITPYFILMRYLGLLNTHIALILAYTSFSLPFSTWMLRGFFASIPKEIDEAAMVDGCSRLQAVFKVVIPLAVPGIGATALFAFLLAWNHYIFALSLALGNDMYTISVGLGSMMGEFRIAWNQLMAASLISTIPSIVLYMFLEQYFVQGLTGGAIKG